MSENAGRSRYQWKAGMSAKVRAGWDRNGTTFKVLGPAVFQGQWWVPINDPEKEDPTHFKEAGLEVCSCLDPELCLKDTKAIAYIASLDNDDSLEHHLKEVYRAVKDGTHCICEGCGAPNDIGSDVCWNCAEEL